MYSNLVFVDKSITVIGAVLFPPFALMSNFFKLTLFDKFMLAKSSFWSKTNSSNAVKVLKGNVAN